MLVPQLINVQPAAATVGWAGGCVFTNAPVTYSPGVVPGPGTTEINLNLSGTCTVNGAVGGGSLAGPVHGGIGACGSGSYTGTLTLSGPAQLAPPVSANATVVVGVDVVTIVMTNGFVFAAAGAFAQLPTATAGCVTGTVTTAQWTGALAFEDPTLDG